MILYAYMCYVCVFSLRRESPDMILEDKPLISEVVLSHLQPGCVRPQLFKLQIRAGASYKLIYPCEVTSHMKE
jgi:hypothetical protein